MYDNSFEQFPGEKLNSEPSEADLARADAWQSAMSAEDTPAFAGDTPMSPEPLTPEAVAPESPENLSDPEAKDNKGLTDAAAIVNYGLNAAAKEYGVETVVQKIKNLDVSNSANPIRDLYAQLGVDTPAEIKDVILEREAAKPEETDFYENSEAAPVTKNRTPEGAFKAIGDMKELISEVEGADPRYEKLREEARSAGKGYFEYAVGSSTNRGLTDLFNTLAAQPKEEEKSPEATPTPESEQAPENSAPDNPENPENQAPENQAMLNPALLSPQGNSNPPEIKI